MFDAVNITPSYGSLTETRQILSGNISQALSSYLGKSVVSKFSAENVTEDEKSTDLSNDLKTKDNDKEKTDSLSDENDDKTYEYTNINYGDSVSITTSFESLAAAVGANGDKVSKEQLFALLQSLITSNSDSEDNAKEITFIKNLIAKFDTLSEGEDYITSFQGVDDPQDYETVTQEQVTPPIDLRI